LSVAVAVLGIYGDRSGIERVEIVPDQESARLVVARWRAQYYDGLVEAWQQKPHGAAERVFDSREEAPF
jgi:hypothetical protein